MRRGVARLAIRLGQQGQLIRAVQLLPDALHHLPPLGDLHHAGRRVPLHGPGPPLQDPSLRHAVRQAVGHRENDRRLSGGLCGRHVTPVLGEEGGKEVGRREPGRRLPLLGPPRRPQGLITNGVSLLQTN